MTLGAIGAASVGAVAASATTTRAGAGAVPAARISHVAPKVSDYGIVIGPLRARDGFRVEIEADGCSHKTSELFVAYVKGNARAALNHTYGGRATCTVSKDFRTATLKARWGSAAAFAVTVSTSAGLRRYSADDGCAKDYVEYRPGRTSGTARLAIHTPQFGTLTVRRDAVQVLGAVGSCAESSGTLSSGSGGGAGTQPISSGGGSGFHLARRASALRAAVIRASGTAEGDPAASADDTTTTPMPTTTPTPTTTTGTTTTGTTTVSPNPPAITPDASGSQLLGLFNRGTVLLQAYQLGSHPPVVILDDESDRDAPARGVIADLNVAIQTPSDFILGAGDSTAEVAAANPFASGTLDFSASRLCGTSSQALDGTMSGAITLHDPVTGALKLDGPAALDAAVGDNDASLETC